MFLNDVQLWSLMVKIRQRADTKQPEYLKYHNVTDVRLDIFSCHTDGFTCASLWNVLVQSCTNWICTFHHMSSINGGIVTHKDSFISFLVAKLDDAFHPVKAQLPQSANKYSLCPKQALFWRRRRFCRHSRRHCFICCLEAWMEKDRWRSSASKQRRILSPAGEALKACCSGKHIPPGLQSPSWKVPHKDCSKITLIPFTETNRNCLSIGFLV